MLLLSCLLMLVSPIWAEGISDYQVLENISDQCAKTEDIFKCLKIKAIKASERALRFESFNLVDGVSLVSNERESRAMRFGLKLNETKLEKLDDDQLNNLLVDSTRRFIENYQLEVKMPELETKKSELLEEGRKRKTRRRGGNAALYWALAIKGIFLAVAYKGIAIMSGLSLIMGKMALLLTAILGLKKLVSSGHETTTFEIIKQPKYSESHTHSTSYEDEDKYHHRAYDIGDNKALRRIMAT